MAFNNSINTNDTACPSPHLGMWAGFLACLRRRISLLLTPSFFVQDYLESLASTVGYNGNASMFSSGRTWVLSRKRHTVCYPIPLELQALPPTTDSTTKIPSDLESECRVPGRYRLFVLFGITSKLTLLALVGSLPSFILWLASSASISMSYPCRQQGESTSINAVSFSEHSLLSE